MFVMAVCLLLLMLCAASRTNGINVPTAKGQTVLVDGHVADISPGKWWLNREHLVQVVTSRQVYDDSSAEWQLSRSLNRTCFYTSDVLLIGCFTKRWNMPGKRVLTGIHSCKLCLDLEKFYTFKFVKFRTNLRAMFCLNQAGVTCQIPWVLELTCKKIYEHVSSF